MGITYLERKRSFKMDDLIGKEAGLLHDTDIAVDNNWTVPVRGTKSYTVVLEFFVKTIKINLSLN